MQPIEYEPSPSKTGVQVVPALVVFHTPPEAAVTKYSLGSSGRTAMSLIRPEETAGPIERSSRPAKRPALNGPSSSFFLDPSVFLGAGAAAAARTTASAADRSSASFLISTSSAV